MELESSSNGGKDTQVALDVIPGSSDTGVQHWLKQIPRMFMARQALLTLVVAGKYQRIATNASARDAGALVKIQDGLFSIIKAIDAVSLMLQAFQTGASNILDKLKVAYLYLLDGFPDFAKDDINAITKDIQSLKASTEKAMGTLDKTTSTVDDALNFVTSQEEGRETDLIAEEIDLDELNKCVRRVGEEMMNGHGSSTTSTTGRQSTVLTCLSFLIFLKENSVKDWISLIITVLCVGVFTLCVCSFHNVICGWSTLVLALVLLAIPYAYNKCQRPKHAQYKPVILIIFVPTLAVLFLCQLLLSRCEVRCVPVIILAPTLSTTVLFICFICKPNHWFFETKDCPNGEKPYLPLHEITHSNGTEFEALSEKLQLLRREMLQKAAKKNDITAGMSDAELTKCFLGKSLNDLSSVMGILQQSVELAEKWYKECKDVLEPTMARDITKAKNIPAEELRDYWNSMAFKKEVVGYYCRWKALQLHCESVRSEMRAKRAMVESWYTENPYPREAVKMAWELADKEASDPEVERVIQHRQQIMEGGRPDQGKNQSPKETVIDMQAS